MAGATWNRYWPWWAAFAWLLVYEGYSLVTGDRTLSSMVWRAQASWPALVYVATGLIVILWIHFFRR
jgi:hypothetical protein